MFLAGESPEESDDVRALSPSQEQLPNSAI